MLLKELLPVFVAAQPHALDLGLLEGIHGDGPHERDVHAQPAVHTRAAEADEDAELGRRPLWGGRVAVAAEAVSRFFLDGEELCVSAWTCVR